MHKLQHRISQKIEGFISSLSTKNIVQIQSKLDDLSVICQAPKEEAIAKLRQQIGEKISLEDLKKRQQKNKKLTNNKNILEIIKRGQTLIAQVDSFILYNYEQLEKAHSILISILQELNNFEELAALSFQDFNRLREQLYIQIMTKLNKFQEQLESHRQEFEKMIILLQLPLKKDEIRKQPPQNEIRLNIIKSLHRESSLLTLKRQISGLLQKQDIFQGNLLQIYWKASVKASIFHFTTGSELHNLQQPGWMFQYIQLVLNSNYKYFHTFILKDIREQISQSITNHFFTSSVQHFLLSVIQVRIKQDKQSLNPFLAFTFLDQLSIFDDKLLSLFGLKADMIQSILHKHELLLTRALQYENERFQTKIFEDFININYSQINLKNLQAYNLMVTFLNLLDRLYRKYKSIKDPSLKLRISKFYRDRIMVLVAHLKTSFDRIYHHSRLPKLDILTSFKRTENELRSNLAEIVQSDPQLQDNLQKEYYSFLQQFYEASALEAVTPVHKKLHISLGDIINKFSSDDDSNHDQLFQGFSKIHREWASKMDQICKFSNYSDNKLRTIFFIYLQAITFSSVGLNLYLKIFEPFLQMIFTEQRHRVLISLITVRRERYLEQIEAHPNSIAFLSEQQTRKLQKFKVKNPDI